MGNEIWKDLVGYEGIYIISSHGRVKRLARDIYHPHFGSFSLKEKLLKCKENHFGYPFVGLTKLGNKFIARSVHRLMMITFFGESDMLVDHINGIRNDNRLSNL